MRIVYLKYKDRCAGLLKNKTVLRYTVVGALNTAFGFSFFPLIYWLLHAAMNINLVVTLSHIFCALFAFVTHKYLTFRTHGEIQREGSKFFLMQLGNWVVNLVLLNIAMLFIALSAFYLQLLIALLMTVVNYFIYRYFVFLPTVSPVTQPL